MNLSSQHRPEQAARNALRQQAPRFLRDAITVGGAVFAIAALVIVAVSHGLAVKEDEEDAKLLESQAKYIASLLDLRAHSWLTNPEQMTTQPYQVLRDRMQKIRQYYPQIRSLFTGRVQDGKLYVVIDTFQPESQTSPRYLLGQSWESPVSLDAPEFKALQSNQISLTDSPALSPDSRHLAAIVPLSNPDPNIKDFLYVDRTQPTAIGAIFRPNRERDLALILAALGAVAAGWLTLSWRSKSYLQEARALSALRTNEELFRSAYELSPVPMYLSDKEGHIMAANKAFCDFIGHPEETISAVSQKEIIHPEDLLKHENNLLHLVSHQAAQYQTELRYLRRGGTTVWGLASVATVLDGDKNISHYMTQVVDISERKKGEDVLRLSEERLELATKAGKVGTWDHDVRRQSLVWNTVMHEIYGTNPETFVPALDNHAAFIHEDDKPRVLSAFRHCFTTGEHYHQEYRILTKNGIRHVKADAVIFLDEQGRSIRAVGTEIDVTAEKEESAELIRAKEAALAADKAKSEFLAVMSHEIRTPLNGVLGFVSMLKNTPLDSEQMSFIETMESSGQGLLALVNDILDISKIESKEIAVEMTTFELRPFIRRIHQQLQAQATQKGLHYDFFVEYSVPKSIHTDQMRLGQILTNILGNALKFTENGQVDLLISAKPVGLFQQNWEWRFTVRDTGPGIPKEALPNLFKLFYQVDSSATRKHGGTGLGLAISQRLANLLDGHIEVESQMHEGTQFTIVINAPRGQGSNVAPIIPTKPIAEQADMKGKRVLVVEDNPVNRKLCALQLQRLGCHTDFAESGLEAIEKVKNHTFDVILMDMQLPDLDGCGATRRIRSEIAGGEDLSIIALTANAMPEDRIRCIEAGMDDFLSKPLQYEKLASTLSKWA